MKNQSDKLEQTTQQISADTGMSRRKFLQTPATVAATSLILPSTFGSALISGVAQADAIGAQLNPRYYPLDNFVPEIDLRGKVAVITGASRGIGRATAEILAKQGVIVIGTSRNPATVPNPPTYPLLKLDITKPRVIKKFTEVLNKKLKGKKVDILINNAGRFVMGPIAPIGLLEPDYYFEQVRLATATLYEGHHIRMTHALLPMMPVSGYARLLYTVSSASYLVSGTDQLTPWLQSYISAKRALLAYTNGLRGTLNQASSNIKISTINPYAIGTTGAEHPHPIYLQPVTDTGYTAESPDAPFNQVLATIRQIQTTGLPPAFVGNTYAQLLASLEPPANVIVGSTQEPYATQGFTTVTEGIIKAENDESAIRFSCG